MKLKWLAVSSALILVSGLAFADHDHACNKGKFDKTNWQAHRADQFEQHQTRLHTMLQLSASQENAWKQFQGQMKPVPKSSPEAHAALAQLGTLERLEKLEALEKQRDEERAQRAQAIRQFYAQLNDAQKKVFDENAFPQHPHF